MSGFERFTERARQVVVYSQEEARLMKHDWIGTEHVLLGLLREEESVAARVLASCDVTVELVRGLVRRISALGDEEPKGQIPFTPRSRKVFELSLREALSLGHNYIGTEHILLGLVRENEGVAARILLDLDVDSEKIRNGVIRALSGPGQRQVTNGRRSPERIGPILRVIEEYWKANPDLRLGQLIGNLANVAKVDPYAIEDGELLDAVWRAWKP